jgi:hypothetical protein
MIFGGLLLEVGRAEEAAVAAAEAVDVWRVVVAADPDGGPDQFADALCALGETLIEAGRDEAALSAVEEAINVYQTVGLEEQLAYAHERRGQLLNALGRASDL